MMMTTMVAVVMMVVMMVIVVNSSVIEVATLRFCCAPVNFSLIFLGLFNSASRNA